MEKNTWITLELLGTNWLAYIFNQLFNFFAVLGITHRTNISWVLGIASVVNIGSDPMLVQIVSAFLSCLEASKCLHLSKHPTVSTQQHRVGSPLAVTEAGRKEGQLQPNSSLSTFIYCAAWQQERKKSGALIEGFPCDLQPLAGQEW